MFHVTTASIMLIGLGLALSYINSAGRLGAAY